MFMLGNNGNELGDTGDTGDTNESSTGANIMGGIPMR